MLLLLFAGTGLPAQPKQRLISSIIGDEDEDESLLCILSLLSAHYRVGSDRKSKPDLTNTTK